MLNPCHYFIAFVMILLLGVTTKLVPGKMLSLPSLKSANSVSADENNILKDMYRMDATASFQSSLVSVYNAAHLKNLGNGLLFGAILALMVYNLYVYVAIKERFNLYHFAYLLFSSLFLLSWSGYFTAPTPARNLQLIVSLGTVSVIFSVLFTNSYLKVSQYSPQHSKVYQWLISVSALPIAFQLAGYQLLAFQLLRACLVTNILYGLIAALLCLRNRISAMTYLMGLSCLTTGISFYWAFGWDMSLPVGLCLQAFLLSSGLAIALNQLKKENLRLQNAVFQQTTGFSQELISSQEIEKRHIATELNNRISCPLCSLHREISLLGNRNKDVQPALFDHINKGIEQTIIEVSEVSGTLHPFQLETLGLKPALESLIETISIHTPTIIQFDMDETCQSIPSKTSVHIYRVIQEMLSNLIKHAEASHCEIRVKATAHSLTLSYVDNGKGYDLNAESRTGMGVMGMSERCKMLGATMAMKSTLNEGTFIDIYLPKL